jgi:predicted nucleic acid-binding protein
VIYFDTSALVKLVFDETESAALAEWLTVRADVPKVSSDLSTIELLRTCRRVDEDAVEGANLLLGGIDLLPMDRAIVEKAATLVPTELRSLDAIHLASALSVKANLLGRCTSGPRSGLACLIAPIRVRHAPSCPARGVQPRTILVTARRKGRFIELGSPSLGWPASSTPRSDIADEASVRYSCVVTETEDVSDECAASSEPAKNTLLVR